MDDIGNVGPDRENTGYNLSDSFWFFDRLPKEIRNQINYHEKKIAPSKVFAFLTASYNGKKALLKDRHPWYISFLKPYMYKRYIYSKSKDILILNK